MGHMGLPGLPRGLGDKIDEFLGLLQAIDTKLDRLIEIEEARDVA